MIKTRSILIYISYIMLRYVRKTRRFNSTTIFDVEVMHTVKEPEPR